jgi:hypothetical protein
MSGDSALSTEVWGQPVTTSELADELSTRKHEKSRTKKSTSVNRNDRKGTAPVVNSFHPNWLSGKLLRLFLIDYPINLRIDRI